MPTYVRAHVLTYLVRTSEHLQCSRNLSVLLWGLGVSHAIQCGVDGPTNHVVPGLLDGKVGAPHLLGATDSEGATLVNLSGNIGVLLAIANTLKESPSDAAFLFYDEDQFALLYERTDVVRACGVGG